MTCSGCVIFFRIEFGAGLKCNLNRHLRKIQILSVKLEAYPRFLGHFLKCRPTY